jgi:predicted amidohydrolase YtcJ
MRVMLTIPYTSPITSHYLSLTLFPYLQGYGDAVAATANPHAVLTNGIKNNLSKAPLFPNQQQKQKVTLYHNCKVYTGQLHQPPAEAFAVLEKKFLAVGSLDQMYTSLSSFPSNNINLVDLEGAHVTPGLIDAHLHLISGGLSLSRLDLRQVASKQEFIDAVRAAVESSSPGEWIQGANWDESQWGGGEVPSAAWINEISPKNPIFLTRMDAHQAVVNDVAMALANLTADTPDPAGGVITRDPITKQPLGLLSDAAMLLVSSAIPPKTIGQRRAGFLTAQEHLLSLGITSVHDMGRIAFLEGEDAAWEDLEDVYLSAAEDGSLKLRVNVFFPLPTWRRLVERVNHVGLRHPGGKLMWGGVKEFYDGSLGSRTALMHEPYVGGPEKRKQENEAEEEQEEQLFGTRTVDKAVFQQQIQGAHDAGLQIAVHAIGDRAVDEVLEAYAALEKIKQQQRDEVTKSDHESDEKEQGKQNKKSLNKNYPTRSSIRHIRHRIEHAQHTRNTAEVRAKMAKLGIVTTPNPLHLLADGNILESRLGKERVDHGAYAFKTLCSPTSFFSLEKENNEKEENDDGNSGYVVCAFASDWPVVPLNPALTLRAASLQPRKESVTPEEALVGITSGAAFVGHREKELGSITPGLFADFVVFSPNSDILDGTLGYAEVRQTFIDGVCVYGCQEKVEEKKKKKKEEMVVDDGAGGDGGNEDVKDEL